MIKKKTEILNVIYQYLWSHSTILYTNCISSNWKKQFPSRLMYVFHQKIKVSKLTFLSRDRWADGM